MLSTITKTLTVKNSLGMMSGEVVNISNELYKLVKHLDNNFDIFTAATWQTDRVLQGITFSHADTLTRGTNWIVRRISAYPCNNKLRMILTNRLSKWVMVVTFTKTIPNVVTLNDITF